MKRLHYKIYYEVECGYIVYAGELPIFKNEKESNADIIKKYLSQRYNLDESDMKIITQYGV